MAVARAISSTGPGCACGNCSVGCDVVLFVVFDFWGGCQEGDLIVSVGFYACYVILRYLQWKNSYRSNVASVRDHQGFAVQKSIENALAHNGV